MSRQDKIESRKKRVENREKRMAKRREAQIAADLKEQKEQEALEEAIKEQEVDDKKLTIEICIHCHRYQHRLCWMLNSILQQKGDVPNINIALSFCPDDGDPTTKEVCDFFREKGLNIYETVLTRKQVPNRSIGRNRQVKEVIETGRADWMLFVDSDMVYDPYFFEDVQNQLKLKYKNVTKVIGADRISLDIPFCVKFFEEDKRKYPCVIPDVAKIPSEWPVKWITGSRTCPGNFQLANVKSIIDRGGVYTKRSRDVWRRTKSDRGFRCQMGGRVSMKVKSQYHLNHDRGGPEIQR